MPKEVTISLRERQILLSRGYTYRVVETNTIFRAKHRQLLQSSAEPPQDASYARLPLSKVSVVDFLDSIGEPYEHSYYFDGEDLFIRKFSVATADISVRLKNGVDCVPLHFASGDANYLLLSDPHASGVPGFVRLHGDPRSQTVPTCEAYFPCASSLVSKVFYVTEEYFNRVLAPRQREYVETYGFSIPSLNPDSWYTCQYYTTKSSYILTSFGELRKRGLVPPSIKLGERTGIIEVETGNPDILLVHPLVMVGPGGHILAAAMGDSKEQTMMLLNAIQTSEFRANIAKYLLTQI